jgi:hypothetical protein
MILIVLKLPVTAQEGIFRFHRVQLTVKGRTEFSVVGDELGNGSTTLSQPCCVVHIC